MKMDSMNPDYCRLSVCHDIVHHKTPQYHGKEQRKMPGQSYKVSTKLKALEKTKPKMYFIHQTTIIRLTLELQQ